MTWNIAISITLHTLGVIHVGNGCREGRGTLQEEKSENSHSWEIQYELS